MMPHQYINMDTPQAKLNYLHCPKGEIHDGEKLNMVCLQTSCLQNLACCCSCVELDHKNHMTKPLKMVVAEARQQAQTIKASTYNMDVILEVVNQSRKAAFEMFEKHRKDITSALNGIQLTLQGYYNSAAEQILVKGTDSNIVIEEAIDRTLKANNPQGLKANLKKVVAALSKSKEGCHLTQQQLINSLTGASDDIRKSIRVSMEEANRRLEEYQGSIQSMINHMNIWEPIKFAFGEKHHTDIKIVDSITVKSHKNSGYKFALMDPSAEEKGGPRTFSFVVKECVSNWIGVGLCHAKVVASKNYGFSFGSIGHGGYMVSSNGGIWSHSSADYNNKIKGFKFKKGDVITVELLMETSRVKFERGADSFQIPVQLKEDDALHPCVLFYYLNDEVAYQPK